VSRGSLGEEGGRERERGRQREIEREKEEATLTTEIS